MYEENQLIDTFDEDLYFPFKDKNYLIKNNNKNN